MKVETCACDICGVQKKETNHWWKAYLAVDGSGVLVTRLDDQSSLSLRNDPTQQWDAAADLCGAQHVLEYLSKNLFHSEPQQEAIR